MAGQNPSVLNPLVADFILIGQKLERLGFIYNKGDVVIFEPIDEAGFG